MSQSSAKTGKCRTNVSKSFLARLWRARHMSCIFQRTDECANVIANVHGLAYRSYGIGVHVFWWSGLPFVLAEKAFAADAISCTVLVMSSCMFSM